MKVQVPFNNNWYVFKKKNMKNRKVKQTIDNMTFVPKTLQYIIESNKVWTIKNYTYRPKYLIVAVHSIMGCIRVHFFHVSVERRVITCKTGLERTSRNFRYSRNRMLHTSCLHPLHSTNTFWVKKWLRYVPTIRINIKLCVATVPKL